MEAMTLGYPPEQAGQISVTATKEEWGSILNRFEWTEQQGPDGAPEKLLKMLEAMGV